MCDRAEPPDHPIALDPKEPTMKAKRGDLAVIVTERRDYYIGQAPQARTEVTLHVVTSITREGIVKAVRDVWDGSTPVPLDRVHARRSALYIVPQVDVDVPAAMATARAHTYPNSDTPMAYASVAEVKAMLSGHRL